ncbi:hypothetical protein CERSUDRAFT_115799 [Gelatoporia subvermispora B]|uniref:Uncharacterized protein n=1 Tax=Ceriporiopsis subvermispora (strain B) TaxID=914234 RepID=M2QFR5_CERS8|nr:hypothetical protein CERSUDRAFT_115799 [Gelatoporia subvermispora B]
MLNSEEEARTTADRGFVSRTSNFAFLAKQALTNQSLLAGSRVSLCAAAFESEAPLHWFRFGQTQHRLGDPDPGIFELALSKRRTDSGADASTLSREALHKIRTTRRMNQRPRGLGRRASRCGRICTPLRRRPSVPRAVSMPRIAAARDGG